MGVGPAAASASRHASHCLPLCSALLCQVVETAVSIGVIRLGVAKFAPLPPELFKYDFRCRGAASGAAGQRCLCTDCPQLSSCEAKLPGQVPHVPSRLPHCRCPAPRAPRRAPLLPTRAASRSRSRAAGCCGACWAPRCPPASSTCRHWRWRAWAPATPRGGAPWMRCRPSSPWTSPPTPP